MGIPARTPHAVILEPTGESYSVTLWLPVGSEIEYVYNRGDWGRVEPPVSCGETPPRALTVGKQATTLRDRVEKWHDLDACG